MATIRERRGPNGRNAWHAQVRKRGWPHQTQTFDTKAQAKAWATTVESEMDRGVFISRTEAESTTLDDALERYAVELVPGKKSSSESGFVRRWRRHPLGRPLDGLNPR